MNNTCNYSTNWQPYIGDYDKYEYDIKLKDGTVVCNCYPNTGYFHAFGGANDGKKFHEDEVAEIRFSEKQVLEINEDEFYN